MDDPNPIIGALRDFYKSYHDGKAPQDSALEAMAIKYAGREPELWKNLYSKYEGGKVPGDDIIIGIVKKYPNTVKKKEPGTSSGSVPTAERTSSIPVITEDDAFRTSMAGYQTAIDDQYKTSLNRAHTFLTEGKFSQEEYDKRAKAAEEKWRSELNTLEKQKAEGANPDIVHEGWDQLKETYKPYFPTQRNQLAEEAIGKMPDPSILKSFVDYADELVASSMGLPKDEARARMSAAYAGAGEFSGNTYAGYLKTRESVVEKNKAKIAQKFPGLPAEALSIYAHGSPQDIEKAGDFSDPKNPYEKLRYTMIDDFMAKTYPDLPDDRRQMLRRDLLDEMKNRPVYEKAKEKTVAQLKERGLADPAEAMKQYESTAGDLVSQFTNSVKVFRGELESLKQTGQTEYEVKAKEMQQTIQEDLLTRQKNIQAQINDGMVSYEAGAAELEDLQKKGEFELKSLFDQYNQDLSRQQREIIQKADAMKASSLGALENLRNKLGIEANDDGTMSASKDYVETFSRLFEENLNGINQEQRLARQEEYDKLSPEQRIGNAVTLGYTDMFDSFGGGLKWLGFSQMGEALTDIAERQNFEIPLDDLGQFDSKDMLEPSWWIDKGVRMLPTTLHLMAVGMGTTGATMGALSKAGMTIAGRTIIGAAVGAAAMRPIEAFMEAGQQFESDLKEGKDVTEASKNASQVMKGNMALYLSDVLQLSMAFGKLPLKVGPGVYGKIVKAGSMLGSGAMNFLTEGGEEVYQGYLQEKTDNPLLSFMEYAQSPEGIEAGVLGGISGVGLSMMSSGGPGQQSAAFHKLLTEYTETEKGQRQSVRKDAENMQKRYFQLIEATTALRDKGLLTEGEFQDALVVAEKTYNSVNGAVMEGSTPLNWRSQAHREYTALASELGGLNRRMEKEKDPTQKEIYTQAAGAVKERMRELINNPNSPTYSIDGMPVTEKDFTSLLANARVRGFVPASVFRVENDLPVMALAAKALGDEQMAKQVAEEFIKSTEEVNTIEEGIDYLDKKIGDAANGRNAKDTVDRYTAIRDVLIELKDKNQRPENHRERVNTGAFDKGLIELNPEEAQIEYERTLLGLEKEQAPIEMIDDFRNSHKELDARVDRSNPETFIGDEVRAEITKTKDEDAITDLFNQRIDDFDLVQKVKENDPELFQELDETLSRQENPSLEQMQRFNQATDPLMEQSTSEEDALILEELNTILEDPSAVAFIEENEPQLIQKLREEQVTGGVSIETARELVNYTPEEVIEEEVAEDEEIVEQKEELTQTDREILVENIARLKEELKEDIKKWFSPKLGLTGFDENQLLDDIETYRKMVELAYDYIRLGMKDISDFANQLGIAIDGNVRNIWAAAKELYKNRVDSVITMEANLSWFDSFREFMQDRDVAIKNLQAELETLGVTIDDASDLYKKRELMVSKVNEAITRFNEKMIGTDPSNVNAKQINAESFVGRMLAAFPENDRIVDDFSLYLYAKHAPDFNARVKEMKTQEQEAKLRELEDKRDNAPTPASASRYQTQIDNINAGNEYIIITNGSGMTDAQAQEVIDYYESQPDFAEFDVFVKEFRKTVIDGRLALLESSGMLSPERIKALREGTKEGLTSVFHNYVPLKVSDEAYFMDFDPKAGGLARPGTMQSIKGTSRFTMLDRNNPFSQALADYAGTIKQIERNETARALWNLMKAQPDASFWDVVPSRAIVSLNESGKVTSVQDLVSQEIKSNSITVVINGKLSYLYFRPMQNKKGVPVINPVLRAMLSNPLMQNETLNGIMEVLRFYISMKRNLITTYNIAFGIPNFSRDITEALGNIETVKQDFNLRHVRARFMANLMPAMVAVAKSPWNATGRMGAWWEEAQMAGMKMSWAKYDQSDEQVTKYDVAVQKYHDRTGELGLPLHVLKTAMNRITTLNDVMENTTRLSLYAALRENGVSAQNAAAAAKNITLNFEKKGTAGNIINSLWLFANAGVQGAARGAKLVVHRRNGRYVLNGRGLALGGSLAAFAFMNKMLFDLWDKDDKDKFLSDFDFENNLYIFNPIDPTKPLKFPKPYSFVRIFLSVGENAYDAISGRTPVARAMMGNVMNSVGTFIDPVGGSQPNKISAWTPELITIPVEWRMNKKWNNTPFHYKEDEDPGSEKYTKKTPPWLVGITDLVNRKTDFLNTGEGFVSISPALIQYVGQQFFGGVGAETIRTVGLVDNAIQGEGLKINETPVLRRFMTDLDDKEQAVVTKFFALTKRTRKYGISDEEIQTAKEAYEMIRANDWLPKTTLTRLKSDFKKKWGVALK